MSNTGRRTPGALGGANRGVGIGVGADTSRPVGPRPRPRREVARGIRQQPVNNRPQRRSTPGALGGVQRGIHRGVRPTPPSRGYDRPPHRPGRRRGSCFGSIAALIVMLVLVFLVVYKDEVKEKIFPTDNVVTEDSATSSRTDVFKFRNDSLLEEHYEKHGINMGYSSADSYEDASCAVVNNPASLHKIEAEDGDDVYYLESTNELVVVSKDGFIRTYFFPEDGIEYYNRQ